MTQTNSNHKVGSLIIVDDEAELLAALCEILTGHGYETVGFTSGAETLEKLKEQDFDLLLTDLMMPEMGGIELLQAALEIDTNIVGIVMTGQGTVQTAVAAMKTGAFDYIMKPFNLNTLLPVLSRAMEVRHLRTENMQLRETVAMHELAQALAFSSDLNQILNKVTDTALQQCDADEASIMLPTSDGKELIVAVARGGHKEHIGKRIPMGQGIAGWVAQNRKPVTLAGEVHDERFTSINPRTDIRAAVSVPLLVGGGLIGVLNVNITRPHRPFTLGQVKTLNMLATIVSPILENSRLYAEKRRAEELYKTLAEGSLAVVFIVQDGEFRFINAAVTSVGYSPEEMIGLNADAIIHPDDREMVKKMGREMLRAEHTTPYEYRMVTKQGEIKWLMQIVSPILYEDRPAILGNAIDITERKLAEKDLRDKDKLLANVVNSTPDYIFVKDTELRTILCNEAFAAAIGKKPNELMGYTDIESGWDPELVIGNPAKGIRGFENDDRDVLSGKTVHNFHDPANMGSEIRIFDTYKLPLYDEDNKIIGVLGIARDITEHKRAQEALQQSEEKYRAILENIQEGYYEVDLAGNYTFFNPAMSKILGYTKEEMMGMSYRLYTDKETAKKVLRDFSEVYRTGISSRADYEQIKKDRSKMFVEASVALMRDSSGQPTGFRGLVRDITDRKKAEEKERESEKKYRDLYDFLPIPVYEMDLEANIISANRAIYETFGGTEEDLKKGFKVWQILSPEELDKSNKNIQKLLEGKQIGGTEYNLIRLDGSVFPAIVISSVIYSNGHPVGIRGAIVDITERKLLEEALRNSQTRLHTLVQTIPDLIWLKDKDGVYLSCNIMFERFFGAKERDIVGKTDYDFMDRELADFFREHDRNAMVAGKPTSNEEWITFADDGHRAFLETIKTPMHDAQGTLIGVLGIGRDITKRKQADEYLKESENKYRLLADHVDDVIFVLDMNLNYTYVSPSVKILRGYEPAEVMKQLPIETLTPSSWDLAMRTVSEAMALEQSGDRDIPISRMLQLEMMRKDGTTVWTEVKFSAIRDENHLPIGILGVTRDITNRKQAEEELRSYAAEISDLYNNAPCGYHSLGPDGTLLRINDTELQRLGYTRDEIIGKKKLSDITTPKSRQLFQEIYPVFKERGWVSSVEFDMIRKDGTILPVLLNATAVKDADGNYIMSRSTTFDNTERKSTEAELGRYRDHLEAMVGIRTNELASKNVELEDIRAAAVSANQAKSDFLASMSHELRTPLNAIIGFSDVLLGTYFGALNEKQKEYTMDILESGKHLLNLINDVLDISKVEAGKMELELAPVEIGNLLASCLVMIKEKTHKHGIDLKVDIPKELLSFEMFADQRKIKQIMFNLLSNAAKFTPDGGAITLSAEHMLQEGKDFLEVSVTDTGIGIPREYQEKIFESFYQIRGGLTDKTPGTGLGLSVAKQLVELHGGGTQLKSEGRGKGSQFSFTLPVNANL